MTYRLNVERDTLAEYHDLDDAIADAEHMATIGCVPESKTYWIEYFIFDENDDLIVRDKAPVDPVEPPCPDFVDHRWTDYDVTCNQGGVVTTDVCPCGLAKIVDTWAMDTFDGEQGLRSVEYHDELQYEIEEFFSRNA